MRDPIFGLFASKPAPVEQPIETPTTQTYASTTLGYAFEYPPTYTLNDKYVYQFGATKTINGVSVTIPASMATGTNLSSDTRVSIEQLPRATTCTADIFIIDNVVAAPVVDSEKGTEYSYASSTTAGAGNLYEELVFAIPGSTPCTAVRYYVHSSNIGNYPAGTVQEFDRSALLNSFHDIRRSLLLN